jgi:hypothetical protein
MYIHISGRQGSKESSRGTGVPAHFPFTKADLGTSLLPKGSKPCEQASSSHSFLGQTRGLCT